MTSDRTAERSFEAIYHAHAPFVWRVLRGMGVAPDAVQDAAQDVFVIVHARLPEFDFACAVTTWLFQITFRVACSARRKSARAFHQPLPDDVRGREQTPQEATERLHSSRLLSELLLELPDDQRSCLVLSDIEGMSGAEIAEITGAPINTVYSRLRRARLGLSQALAARGWRGP